MVKLMSYKDALHHVQERFERMRSERNRFEGNWDMDDIQFYSNGFVDNNGKLVTNDSIEKSLIEIYV